MALNVGFLGIQHGHAYGYAGAIQRNPRTSLVSVWDRVAPDGARFASAFGISPAGSAEEVLAAVDAVVITSENTFHAELAVLACQARKHVLCEKPLVTKVEDGRRMIRAADEAGVVLMTAFPCRFSPAYERVKHRVQNGEIGAVVACCATNHGMCPIDWGWIVDPELSGGGAMIDHTVHVTDLLRDLLGCDPVSVNAQIGHNMYGRAWDDVAMLTLEFENGVFATLDSSWSRPKSYKTWGDVTMNVVGEAGVIEMDMFGPSIDLYTDRAMKMNPSGFGSDLDALLLDNFIAACLDGAQPRTTAHDGLQAARVAIAGYESARAGQPVTISG